MIIKLKVVKIEDLKIEERVGGIFESPSPVKAKVLIDEATGADDLRIAIITFPPGGRTKVHIHTKEQVLYILSGKGIIANESEEHTVTPGYVAFIPPGEKHWHGAVEDESFSHISIRATGETEW